MKTRPFDILKARARYKVLYGGRGGAKSWNTARALLLLADLWCLRILCAREFQSSIADSVHRLLCDQIIGLGLQNRFFVTKNSIVNLATGSSFIFKGLRHSIKEIKSTAGIHICWVEEAQSVSEESWEILIPTIRENGSEIWISFNPENVDDPTYQRFVIRPPPNALVRKVGWQDSPFFPDTLNNERLYLKRIDQAAYDYIWEGEPRLLSDAIIFKDRYEIQAFDTDAMNSSVASERLNFQYGSDWGFAKDPTTLIRSFTVDRSLFIDHEAYGYETKLNEIPALFDRVPESRKWPIKADCSRPETISYVRGKGFNIKAAKKWGGSVEDGIEHLKGFERIVVHPRCKNIIQEFKLYSYKVDKVTKDPLPIIVSKHDHGIDALRYSLDGYIQKANLNIWARLAQ